MGVLKTFVWRDPRFAWITLFIIGALWLTACSSTGDTADESKTPAPDPDGDTSSALETEFEATPTREPLPGEAAAESGGPTLLTGDDRSDQLRSLTSDWGTNWEQRTISTDELFSGGPPRDGIPSIDNPEFVSVEEAGEWLAAVEPVLGIEINGDARAYPLQILTWHEIVNDTVGGTPTVVTFCPLCNSALVFDRRVGDEVFEFGTSGLLRNSDLIMYDRTTETLWQQFTGEAVIGDLAGEQLTFLPSAILSFGDFRQAYPEGVVLSRNTGYQRSYGRNPYVGYDAIGSAPFLFVGEPDNRLQAMARVVTVSLADVDVAYPYETLAEVRVINHSPGGHDLVVFFKPGTASALDAATIAEGENVGATGVFSPVVDGERLNFVMQDDAIVDTNTGSMWNIAGQATTGPLTGVQLTPIVHGDQFWFSWAAFKPGTIIYSE